MAKQNSSKHVKVDTSVDTEDLSRFLANELNKLNKDGGKVAYFLDDEDDPSKVSEWVSTGSTMLDLIISNRPYGGLPVGRITTLSGLEGTGKSLICAHIVAETQKRGGIAVYIDTESASAPEFWRALGVNLKTMVYMPKETIEEAFQYVEYIIGIVRKSDKNKLCTIIVDSIAGASTQIEMESGYERKGYATTKSLIVSEAMRKLTNLVAKRRILLVFTNQLRQNLQAMTFGDKWCVDPFTTQIQIRHNGVEEKLFISEFAERFLELYSFYKTEDHGTEVIDTSKLGVEILGCSTPHDCNRPMCDSFNKINKFIIKPGVQSHYTDGKLHGTDMHRIIENGKEIHLKDHPDFKAVDEFINVVDFEIENSHNYYANGRLNHNTEPCGKALSFHSSVKVRFECIGKLKNSDKDILGVDVRATVKKNRVGPAFKQVEFEVYFDSGIADYASWLKVAKKKGIITGPLNSIAYKDEKFNTNSFVDRLNTDAVFKDTFYKELCESIVMQYKTPNTIVREDLIKEPVDEADPDVIEED